MEQGFERSYVENLLCDLDEQGQLFPQFALTKLNHELKLLGTGGFSTVYEMYNKERPDRKFALKVCGFQSHTVGSEEFQNTNRIQWILGQESQYVVRILDTKELDLGSDEKLHLQFVLMDKLDELIEKDRFGKAKLIRAELNEEAEVLKLAFEIGQALAAAHSNECLHRDIKLENIFWDTDRNVYKLGDFGMAKKTEDGTAETVIYTDGYGAPEIERRLFDKYNATADIYSFGITLYLLLNDLKFPGSDGYYSKAEVQYNADYIFPAPAHASEGMTRVIRKMCSFYAADRYRSMNEVLQELSWVLGQTEAEVSDDLLELADFATETYQDEETQKQEPAEQKTRAKTRAERKAQQRNIDSLYRISSSRFFFGITALMILLLKGLQPESAMVLTPVFCALTAAVLLEAMLQRLKEFHLIFGAGICALAAYSISVTGLTVPHILLLLCVLIGCPVLTLAGGVSTGVWLLLECTGRLSFLNYLSKWDLGWIVWIVLLLAVNRYFRMRIDYEKTTYVRAFIGIYIYDKMFPIMVVIGLLLFGLDKFGVLTVPDMVRRMHFVRTGVIMFPVMYFLTWWDGLLDKQNPEEGEVAVEDDERLDERGY